MKNSLFGVIIKVNDIDLCRFFYRDVLTLGEPVVDSSFWVEFQTDSGFFLMLEKTTAGFLEHESSATSWACRVPSINTVKEHFRRYGYKLNIDRRLHEGEVLYRCQDPEKNIFYIFSDEPEDPEIKNDRFTEVKILFRRFYINVVQPFRFARLSQPSQSELLGTIFNLERR